MKVGYAVQGSTDRAFLHGLRDRWCRGAELVEGAFRGSTGRSLRRELAQICDDLFHQKSCDLLVFLSDADVADWREVQGREFAKLPEDIRVFAVYGMADRNIECWLCADRHYVAKKTGRKPDEFDVQDPKGVFESAMNITRDDKQEEQIASFVAEAPLAVMHRWLDNRSFENFFEQLWTVSRRMGCTMENLRESTATP